MLHSLTLNSFDIIFSDASFIAQLKERSIFEIYLTEQASYYNQVVLRILGKA